MAQNPSAPASSESRDRVRATVPKMIEVTEKVLFGDIWERPELSKRDRSLVVCAVLTATYRPEQLKGHLQRALDNGLTKTEMSEMITHVAFYAGLAGVDVRGEHRPRSVRSEPVGQDQIDESGLYRPRHHGCQHGRQSAEGRPEGWPYRPGP